MNADHLFYNILFEKELHSFQFIDGQPNDGEYKLEISSCVTEGRKVDTSYIENSSLPLTEKLSNNLVDIYSQVNKISLHWSIDENTLKQKLKDNKWLKDNFSTEEFGFQKIRETLGGAINLVRPNELFGLHKNSSIKIGSAEYFQFDSNYSLIACFKLEEEVINDNIYIINTEDINQVHDMNVTSVEYLNLAFEAKIFNSWQLAYLFKDGFINENMKVMLPEILQDIEISLPSFE